MHILEYVGWLGTGLYLLNHAYISYAKNLKKWVYYLGNLIAASILTVTSLIEHSWQAVVINGFWALISLLLILSAPIQKIAFPMSAFHRLIFLFWPTTLVGFYLDFQLGFMILGWSSAFAFCASYLLFNANIMKPIEYFIWNTYAAIVLLPQLWIDMNYPVFGLELAWAVISLYGVKKRYQHGHLID